MAKVVKYKHPDDPRSTSLTRVIGKLTGVLGSFPAIVLAVLLIASWIVGLFIVKGGFLNSNYQLIINTLTTIITFLMVFVIQNTQNRDGRALQTKLDATIEALAVIADKFGIDPQTIPRLDELVGVEDAPDATIRREQDEVRGNAVHSK